MKERQREIIINSKIVKGRKQFESHHRSSKERNGIMKESKEKEKKR